MATSAPRVRFVVGADGEPHRQLTGIFTEARLLRDRGELSVDESERLDDAYTWFNEHVPVPPFATRRWRSDVACWFKGEAATAISRMWDITAIMREQGVPTRLLRSI